MLRRALEPESTRRRRRRQIRRRLRSGRFIARTATCQRRGQVDGGGEACCDSRAERRGGTAREWRPHCRRERRHTARIGPYATLRYFGELEGDGRWTVRRATKVITSFHCGVRPNLGGGLLRPSSRAPSKRRIG